MTDNLNTQIEARVPFLRSLRGRLLLLLLGVTIVTILIATYLSITFIRQVGQTAQAVSSEALQVQAEEYLLQITTENAKNVDLILKQAQLDVQKVATYAATVFNNPEAFAHQNNWSVEERMFVAPEGHYINTAEDLSSAVVPNTVTIDDKIRNILESASYLDFVFAPVYDRDPHTVAIYLTTLRMLPGFIPILI